MYKDPPSGTPRLHSHPHVPYHSHLQPLRLDKVLGDVFFLRTCDDGRDKFERHNFTLADMSSSAPWVREAAAHAASKAAADRDPVAKKSQSLPQNASKPSAPKPRVPPTEATIAGWRKQLDEWVANKLKQWDDDAEFRKSREDKYPDRNAYAVWLQGKADGQLKARLS